MQVSIKNQIILIKYGLLLILADQLIKIIIHLFFFEYNFSIFEGVLRFSPIINTKLSWGGNYTAFLSIPIVIYILNIIVLFVILTGYNYYLSFKPNPSAAAQVVYILGMSGGLCSLIDKTFWGGSLDYIRFFDLFTFDLKDCYLSVFEALFIFLIIKYKVKINVKGYLMSFKQRI